MAERIFSMFPRMASAVPLPQRLHAPIAQLEARSERLITAVQIALILLFGLLFALGPRPVDVRAMMYEPVPAALAIYAAQTLLRLAISFRRPLSDLEVALSIIADAALLAWLAWSFHQQYGRDPAFALKVPTFGYFFLLVALRALRFDPRLVLFTGAVSIIAWAVLVVAVLASSGDDVVTHSFVDYLAGDRVLIGAEVEKLAVLAAVTLLLAAAIASARRTMLKAVSEEAGAREIGRFLSTGLAKTIRDAAEPLRAGAAQTRDLAIIMLDIRGFTRFAASAPAEDVVRLLTSLHEVVLPVVWRHGGVIDKFLGDGVMITFGAVTPTQTAAADALAALAEVMEAVKAWENVLPPASGHLRLNAAATCGDALFVTLGAGERLEYTVIGPCVNLAAKLEQHNKTEGTRALATRSLVERAGGLALPLQVPLRPLGPRAIAGLDAPVDIVAVA